jgi:hypothetical protein
MLELTQETLPALIPYSLNYLSPVLLISLLVIGVYETVMISIFDLSVYEASLGWFIVFICLFPSLFMYLKHRNLHMNENVFNKEDAEMQLMEELS